MKNPLNNRFKRQLKNDFAKYLVIFLLIVIMVALTSGFQAANNSVVNTIHNNEVLLKQQSGYFVTKKKLNKAQIDLFEKEANLKVYEEFYKEESIDNDTTFRFYKVRNEVDLQEVLEGRLPENANELAIERLYAANNNLDINDELTYKGITYKIVGKVSLVDYSCLFKSNSDMMLNAITFGVGLVTEDGFNRINKEDCKYRYAYVFNDETLDDEFKDILLANSQLEEFVSKKDNKSITFVLEDAKSDSASMYIFLYLMIIMTAYIFSIIIINMIQKDATVIGTLMASGYSEHELIMHFMFMPSVITILAVIVGNILGYTWIKDVCAGMYYGSYSLPTYTTIWNSEAFILTTIIPVLIMVVVNYVLLKNSLSLLPLKFIRRDLSKTKNRKAIHLSKHIPFFDRFRTRVILQNISNYITLFIGILFANLLLLFGLILPSILKDYQASIENNLFSQYQTILKMPYSALDEDKPLESLVNLALYYNRVETDTSDAEKFSAYTLETINGNYKKESVQLYGIINGSKYIDIDFDRTSVVISHAYAEKYHLKIGDSITLHKPYSDDNYNFTIDGIYPYDGAICLFMAKDNLNEMFDLGDSFFCGYFSNEPITDIDEKNIANVVDVTSLTKVSRQLDVSMGSMMYLVDGFAILIFVILIYLLSKIIIEKNAQSISMVKILGYKNLEISKLYIIATSIMVVLFILISFPIEEVLMTKIYQEMLLMELSGYLPITFSKIIYIKMFLLGVGTYAIVAIFEYKKIERITLAGALKNVE